MNTTIGKRGTIGAGPATGPAVGAEMSTKKMWAVVGLIVGAWLVWTGIAVATKLPHWPKWAHIGAAFVLLGAIALQAWQLIAEALKRADSYANSDNKPANQAARTVLVVAAALAGAAGAYMLVQAIIEPAQWWRKAMDAVFWASVVTMAGAYIHGAINRNR